MFEQQTLLEIFDSFRSTGGNVGCVNVSDYHESVAAGLSGMTHQPAGTIYNHGTLQYIDYNGVQELSMIIPKGNSERLFPLVYSQGADKAPKTYPKVQVDLQDLLIYTSRSIKIENIPPIQYLNARDIPYIQQLGIQYSLDSKSLNLLPEPILTQLRQLAACRTIDKTGILDFYQTDHVQVFVFDDNYPVWFRFDDPSKLHRLPGFKSNSRTPIPYILHRSIVM